MQNLLREFEESAEAIIMVHSPCPNEFRISVQHTFEGKPCFDLVAKAYENTTSWRQFLDEIEFTKFPKTILERQNGESPKEFIERSTKLP